mmetsp:Transcript_4244/g.13376  ORF Transcript_4244/g.13376 Transcript_4244/m.13376 type:complete len:215 (-) Transcript_4244:262-906(-)
MPSVSRAARSKIARATSGAAPRVSRLIKSAGLRHRRCEEQNPSAVNGLHHASGACSAASASACTQHMTAWPSLDMCASCSAKSCMQNLAAPSARMPPSARGCSFASTPASLRSSGRSSVGLSSGFVESHPRGATELSTELSTKRPSTELSSALSSNTSASRSPRPGACATRCGDATMASPACVETVSSCSAAKRTRQSSSYNSSTASQHRCSRS